MAAIVVIRYGRTTVEKSGATYLTDPGVRIELAWNGAAVTAGETRVLVDTGVHDVEWARRFAPVAQTAEETFEGALALARWRPDDVDLVINTHLHFDHCGNNSRLPHARFVVQARELAAARNPPRHQAPFYPPALFEPPAVAAAAWIVVEGEAEVAPGVRVFPTPGHAEGHQSVLVETDEGRVVIAGDAANLLENLAADVVPGIFTDLRAAEASLDELRRQGEFVIPGHDPIVRPGQRRGFPPMPRPGGGA